MKRNPFIYIVFVFLFLNVVDIITTIYILPGESNPLYLMTNSLVIMLILKIIIMGIVGWIAYKSKFRTKTLFFFFVTIMVYGSLALLIAQAINIYAIFHPAIIEAASKIPAAEKAASYNKFMSMIYLFPIAFSMICFWIYDKSIQDIELFTAKRKWYEFWKL